MGDVQRAIVLAQDVLALAAVVGLFARRRYDRCYSFVLYLCAIFVPGVMVSFWPEHFFHEEFWLLKETIHNVLKFAIALELAIRTFHAFPGAQATARRTLFVALAVTYVAVLAVPGKEAGYTVLAGQLLPRILNGTIWLFTGIAGLILWYRLPVDPLHKAILVGFVPYLLIFSAVMNSLDAFGWHLREATSYAYTTAYLVLLAYWNHAAWRRAPAPSRAGSAQADDAAIRAAS